MQSLRCGVIGVGYFGKNYVRLLGEIPGVRLAATAQTAAVAARVIQDPAIDCVVIATPAVTHAALTLEALRAGKHVLVEKPMVLTLADAQALRAVVQERHRVLLVGHQYLYHDHLRYLRDQLARGVLGSVRYCFAEHLYLGPLRRDVGAFWDSATHILAIVDYLFGPCQIVDARGSALAMREGSQDDFTVCEVSFTGGLLLTMVLSRFFPQKERRLVLGGTAGFAVFDDGEPEAKLKFFRSPYPTVPAVARSSRFLAFAPDQVETPAVVAQEPLRNQVQHFLDCIAHQRVPLTDVEHGLRITRWLQFIALRLGLPAGG